MKLHKTILSALGAAGMLMTTANTAMAASYHVKANDTVSEIAYKYGVSINSIEKLNNINTSTHLIYVGQTIKIPTSTNSSSSSQASNTQVPNTTSSTNPTSITIKSGDTLSSIARRYGTTVAKLKSLNNLSSDLIYAGASLKIAGNAASVVNPTNTVNNSTVSSTTSQNKQQSNTSTNAASTSTTTTVTSQTTTTTSTSKQTVSQAPSASSVDVSSITSYALSFLGTPYVYGGTSPAGFDCSGFVQYVFNKFGKNIGRTTYQQEYAGTKIDISQAQPGDLYFWGSYGSAYHVAIALGGGQYVMAPAPGQTVRTGSIQYYTPSFAVHVN
ncbi:cell wall-associated NlpC family hydrolase [Lactobacillus colini]|uniref:Cell wall-associated NlpC family hydrolase n=1 Tax=Lactobacillus colini TaxID=1819254 RepID=A0ABS4MC83_9LACO|nr:C40 family peptidase [Lactobacillus colini]MBP2057300.1 cell wall-associated NlpC family hydrolase [Lactobacillus colini]